MKTINITATILDIDGATPYPFNAVRRRQNGEDESIAVTSSFKDIFAAFFRQARSRKEEEKAAFDSALAQKIATATGTVQFSDEEISKLKAILISQPDFVYVQFLGLIEG